MNQRQTFQPETMPNFEVQEPAITSILTEDEERSSHEGKLVVADDVAQLTNKSENHNSQVFVAAGDSDQINRLLERCNIIQNSMDKKLSIYF
ncbi:hypothetical protein SLE2022_252000 [Rubroshorea leprosula]